MRPRAKYQLPEFTSAWHNRRLLDELPVCILHDQAAEFCTRSWLWWYEVEEIQEYCRDECNTKQKPLPKAVVLGVFAEIDARQDALLSALPSWDWLGEMEGHPDYAKERADIIATELTEEFIAEFVHTYSVARFVSRRVAEYCSTRANASIHLGKCGKNRTKRRPHHFKRQFAGDCVEDVCWNGIMQADGGLRRCGFS